MRGTRGEMHVNNPSTLENCLFYVYRFIQLEKRHDYLAIRNGIVLPACRSANRGTTPKRKTLVPRKNGERHAR
jgi:hypothetical protein